MFKKAKNFVNRAGEKIELCCEMDIANGELTYKKVILPTGNKVKPHFFWGNRYVFILYKQDKWYSV